MTSSSTRLDNQKSKILKENELRAFPHCSEFYFRGGTVDLSMNTAALEFIYIGLILAILRDPYFDFQFELNRQCQKLKRHLKKASIEPHDIDIIIRSAAFGVQEIFKILPPHLYVPVFGPFEYPVKISDTLINMKISSVLTTKMNAGDVSSLKYDPDYRVNAIHAVTFSPFHTSRDMENDLVQQIKALTIGSANPIKVRTNRPKVKLHIFSASTNATQAVHYGLIEHRVPYDNKAWSTYLEKPIKVLESGFHYPLVSCPHSCPFKSTCNVDPFLQFKESNAS